MTYVALLLDNLHGDLLAISCGLHGRPGDVLADLLLVEELLLLWWSSSGPGRRPPRAAPCAAEA